MAVRKARVNSLFFQRSSSGPSGNRSDFRRACRRAGLELPWCREFCKASLSAWKRIAGEFAANSQVEVVGISVDSVQVTREYVEEHGLEFPVVSFTDRKLRALYRAGITPQTLIIDAEGKVSFTRIGAVTETGAIDSIIDAVPVSIHELSNRLHD